MIVIKLCFIFFVKKFCNIWFYKFMDLVFNSSDFNLLTYLYILPKTSMLVQSYLQISTVLRRYSTKGVCYSRCPGE